ncbi:hypothetical protein TRV_01387 [Trichophyton verrucosum HKI 0517]|uniref:Uncharacterized protein n=1 Tax=Trichophyton verrucosum (strain HKI 0517) TaxID=663202 RepID=D4D2T1_TRIVH|nr:uncharacterized protein TRV_01387 [Trichophyton verrucosum HKI 0517]EFE43813.1 hypothetical protein TRV_01387 [Trichophyton verrucosum HKI 0517]
MKFLEVEERQISCGNAGSAGITAGPMAFDESKGFDGKGQKIIEFDCRGLEFTEFKADGKWEATGTESGTKFSDISLEENEWYDFDEKQGEEVNITENHPKRKLKVAKVEARKEKKANSKTTTSSSSSSSSSRKKRKIERWLTGYTLLAVAGCDYGLVKGRSA